jgi:hypothetical protein
MVRRMLHSRPGCRHVAVGFGFAERPRVAFGRHGQHRLLSMGRMAAPSALPSSGLRRLWSCRNGHENRAGDFRRRGWWPRCRCSSLERDLNYSLLAEDLIDVQPE